MPDEPIHSVAVSEHVALHTGHRESAPKAPADTSRSEPASDRFPPLAVMVLLLLGGYAVVSNFSYRYTVLESTSAETKLVEASWWGMFKSEYTLKYRPPTESAAVHGRWWRVDAQNKESPLDGRIELDH